MRRYELKEGTSNKFWEIELEGDSFTTRFGRIGTEGQTSTKEFDGPAQARKAYDKIVAEKEKKGYLLVSKEAPGDVGPGDASNPDLEAAIVANPHDDSAFLVYGDWLAEHGDPRGELVAIQAARAKNPSDAALERRERDFFVEHESALLGKLMEVDGVDEELALTWRLGFIDSATLGGEEFSELDAETACRRLLSLTSAKFLRSLTLLALNTEEGEPDYEALVEVIAETGLPPTLEKLAFDIGGYQISWTHLGDLSPLYAHLGNLRELRIKMGHMELGKIALPKLRRLEIVTGGFSRANMKSIVTAAWPELEALTLYFGDEEYGGDCTVDDLAPILAASDIPRVKHLGLANAPFADELARELPRSKVLAQLATLDISKGTLSDEGAAAIIERAAAFTHLESLDVSESFLSEGVVERLTSALGKVAVSADDQGDPEDEYRFVQVAE